jgi:hypothetical protein
MGTDILYVELVFSPPVDSARLPALGIPAEAAGIQGNALVLRAADIDQANRWTESVRALGGRLCSMVPVKRRLEDFYAEQVAAGRGGKGEPG